MIYEFLYFFFEDPSDKARKYLEGLDGVKFNEIQVPDQLKKQLEYFDRDVNKFFSILFYVRFFIINYLLFS